MLWFADKFTAREVIIQAFLPSLTIFLVSTILIGRTLVSDSRDIPAPVIKLDIIDWIIIVICLSSFLLPVFMPFIKLPPYMGLIFGLGFVWFVVDILKPRITFNTRLSVSIEKFFQRTDISSLYFFIGILFAVEALNYLGILADLSKVIFSEYPSQIRIIIGSIFIGLMSALFDNIPLTAAAIDIVKTSDPKIWSLLAVCIGVGGSLLLIGSAPGIIAMSLIKKLNFSKYLKIATIPGLIAYFCGILVWLLQNSILF